MQRLEPRRSPRKSIAWSFDSPTEPSPSPFPDFPDYGPRRPGWLTLVADRLGSRRGLLKSFTKIPMDVLFEIFSHLHPQDVLNLARTTKRLREVLMDPSARVVWMASLANVQGLPDCPSDLTEPQFANLAFDTSCHVRLHLHVRISCRVS
ncbi:hypothetical protein BDN72DRAFT_758228 [Pluteus cervinus]|uniref:Uncharacterized protein n=1 Tax=Pluteus cervinus TaxID=181527 RepID=A0ACD3BAX6_9AGAR|nr:hypothetical protein BDN72DRAFT_758228 [Pluteus cervinus]